MTNDMERGGARGCPVDHTDYRLDREVFGHYRDLGERREESPVFWNDTTEAGYWMVTRHEHVSEALRMTDVFSNRIINTFEPDSAPPLLPNRLDGKEHRDLRRILNPLFAPSAVRKMEDRIRRHCIELIEEVQPEGSTDFVADFAIRFPTDLFLDLMGLPSSEAKLFVPWAEATINGFFGKDVEAAHRAERETKEYFAQTIEDRAARPRDPDHDLVTRLLQARVDGEPMAREDILTTCHTLMTAGLDTTRSALGYLWLHLATHPDDRALVINSPHSLPQIIEESLRLYPLVLRAGRVVSEDVDYLGCSMREGDLVWLGLASANRDPREFPEPNQFSLDRENTNRHLAFGAGPHRCIGMHHARLELRIALEEWHARIPDYRVREGVELQERGGQLALLTLPLEWQA